MFEASNTDVAGVAEQTSDRSCFVTVIHFKPAPPSGFVGSAYRATSDLLRQHAVVFSGRKVVVLLSVIIPVLIWVLISMTFLLSRGFFRISSPPSVMRLVSTTLAALVLSVPRHTGRMKFVQWLLGLALLARLHSLRISAPRRAPGKFSLSLDSARLAVGVQTVRFGSVFMKLVERFVLFAGETGFHRSVLQWNAHYKGQFP